MLIIEILHDLRYQNQRNSGSIVYIGSYRIYIISSRSEVWAPELGPDLSPRLEVWAFVYGIMGVQVYGYRFGPDGGPILATRPDVRRRMSPTLVASSRWNIA